MTDAGSDDADGVLGLLGWGGAQTTAKLDPMLLEDALNQLTGDAQTPRDRLFAALEMCDDGVALQQLTFRRRFPELAEQELQHKLDGWLARENEAP